MLTMAHFSDDEAPGLKSSKGKKVKRKAKDDNKDGSKEQVIALDISDAEGGESEVILSFLLAKSD